MNFFAKSCGIWRGSQEMPVFTTPLWPVLSRCCTIYTVCAPTPGLSPLIEASWVLAGQAQLSDDIQGRRDSFPTITSWNATWAWFR